MQNQDKTCAARSEQPGDFYEALMNLHRDVSEDESRIANARFLLMLHDPLEAHGLQDEALTRARHSARG